MMMTANLIGFAIGMEGMAYLWGQLIGTWQGRSLFLNKRIPTYHDHTGIRFLVIACSALFVGVQLMMEYR